MPAHRSNGILLHITSLPSSYGIGDLGPSAYQFADFLERTHQQIWQILPLGPVGLGASPYSSPSTFAGNPLLISPDRLRDAGFLTEADLRDVPDLPTDHVDYSRAIPLKHNLLTRAFERFESEASAQDVEDFELFCAEQADWLTDYALYRALKSAHDDAPWTAWPDPITLRDPDALREARREHERTIRKHEFWQFLFDRQWTALRTYCNERSIQLFGDIPIYVAEDSADVWAHQGLFHLDDQGKPTVVAGVPPDFFAEEGQRWGNPIYRWDTMRDRGFRWWTRRVERTLDLVDLVRIDHFRGFSAYWEIPAEEETAVHGQWVQAPGEELFHTLEDRLGNLPVVAEDLGIITSDVTDLRKQFDFPGMAVLQFAFYDDPASEYLPHNFERDVVAYTGTHDNNTTLGWWTEEIDGEAKDFARTYLDLDESVQDDLSWMCIRMLMASVANRVVIPLQDVLELGAEARMNLPGNGGGNWEWRFTENQLTNHLIDRLKTLTYTYGRAPD